MKKAVERGEDEDADLLVLYTFVLPKPEVESIRVAPRGGIRVRGWLTGLQSWELGEGEHEK